MKAKVRSRELDFPLGARIAWAILVIAMLASIANPAYAQDPEPGARGGEIVAALRSIAVVVIDILIGVSVILMSIGIATGFVGGQFMVTVGQPYGLSSAWVKVISVVILGIGALLTIVIVNTIINSIAGLVPATQIPTL